MKPTLVFLLQAVSAEMSWRSKLMAETEGLCFNFWNQFLDFQALQSSINWKENRIKYKKSLYFQHSFLRIKRPLTTLTLSANPHIEGSIRIPVLNFGAWFLRPKTLTESCMWMWWIGSKKIGETLRPRGKSCSDATELTSATNSEYLC